MAVGVAWCIVAIITFILSLIIKKSNKNCIDGMTTSFVFLLLALYFILDSMAIAGAMLCDTEQTEEQNEYTRYIMKNSDQ